MAKNYRSSDWAQNKYSAGIVYSFIGKTIEVTLEDYLAENPQKTKQDYFKLKAISDSIFHQQDIADNAYARHKVSFLTDKDNPILVLPSIGRGDRT